MKKKDREAQAKSRYRQGKCKHPGYEIDWPDCTTWTCIACGHSLGIGG